jgi:hypothetical protein
MENLYRTTFLKVLTEEPEMEDQAPELSDADAFKGQLDKGTDESDFDVDAQAVNDAQVATNRIEANMVSELKGWILKLEDFGEFLNGVENGSIQSKLSKAVPDTLFDKMRVAETKKIARVAMEIKSLNEMLKGYLASAKDPKYKFV